MFDDPRWKAMTPNKKGALAEIIACKWLLMEGYSVYKNISSWGVADVIVMLHNELIAVDIAVASQLNDSKKICAEQRIKDGHNVKYLYVLSDGSCKWRDEMFKMAIKICVCCKREFNEKEKSTKKRCPLCKNKGLPQKPVFKNKKQMVMNDRNNRLKRYI